MKRILFVTLTSFFLQAQVPSEAEAIYKVLKYYQSKETILMNIKKKFSQPFLNKESQTNGKLYFSKGLWRLEFFSSHNTQMIYNGKRIIYKSNKDNILHYLPSSQANALPAIFDQKAFNQKFKYQNKTQKGRTHIYHFKGITKEAPPKISIQIEKDRILSLRIQFEEPLGEEYYRFSSISFNKKVSKKLFQEP